MPRPSATPTLKRPCSAVWICATAATSRPGSANRTASASAMRSSAPRSQTTDRHRRPGAPSPSDVPPTTICSVSCSRWRLPAETGRRLLKGARRLAPLLRYIQDHLRELITRDELAHVAGWSPTRLSVVFKETFDEPPMTFVRRLRLQRARTELAFAGATVTEVADRYCFTDAFHLEGLQGGLRRAAVNVQGTMNSGEAAGKPPLPGIQVVRCSFPTISFHGSPCWVTVSAMKPSNRSWPWVINAGSSRMSAAHRRDRRLQAHSPVGDRRRYAHNRAGPCRRANAHCAGDIAQVMVVTNARPSAPVGTGRAVHRSGRSAPAHSQIVAAISMCRHRPPCSKPARDDRAPG